MRFTKHTYLNGFTFVVIALALGRCGYDFAHSHDNTKDLSPVEASDSTNVSYAFASGDSIQEVSTPHRIYSVPSFANTFPDNNDVQLVAANKNGVRPPKNRAEAERRLSELVYAGANPYFHVDKMKQSIPYLVPKASMLLQDIGRSFYDSLYIKGIPLHQIIVTSILRTDEDVANLQKVNHNATENSCHRYGTTFDICYNRYKTVSTKAEPRRQVRNDTLKWVLAEVLRDKREAGRCYVKHEVKQGCFHITVR